MYPWSFRLHAVSSFRHTFPYSSNGIPKEARMCFPVHCSFHMNSVPPWRCDESQSKKPPCPNVNRCSKEKNIGPRPNTENKRSAGSAFNLPSLLRRPHQHSLCPRKARQSAPSRESCSSSSFSWTLCRCRPLSNGYHQTFPPWQPAPRGFCGHWRPR